MTWTDQADHDQSLADDHAERDARTPDGIASSTHTLRGDSWMVDTATIEPPAVTYDGTCFVTLRTIDTLGNLVHMHIYRDAIPAVIARLADAHQRAENDRAGLMAHIATVDDDPL